MKPNLAFFCKFIVNITAKMTQKLRFFKDFSVDSIIVVDIEDNIIKLLKISFVVYKINAIGINNQKLHLLLMFKIIEVVTTNLFKVTCIN
jgi:hypothetical protein